MARKLSKKAIEARISAAYKIAGNYVAVPMWELSNIWRTGEAAIEKGAGDAELVEAIRAHVERVKVAA